MAAFYDATGRKLNEDEWRYAFGLPASDNRITQWLVYQAKYVSDGTAAAGAAVASIWPDFKACSAELAPFFADPTLAHADIVERAYGFQPVARRQRRARASDALRALFTCPARTLCAAARKI
jgi:hypothetical protein